MGAFLRFPRSGQALFAFIHDLVMAAFSFLLSLFLRLGNDLFAWEADIVIRGTVLFTAVSGVVFLSMRLYAGVWRYASLNDLSAITRAVTLSIMVFLPLLFLMTRLDGYPRSTLIINWFVLMGLLGGPRFLYRMVKDRRLDFSTDRGAPRRVPVLLVGAGDAAELFIRALLRNQAAAYKVVGIVDEKRRRVGRNIHGVHVLGGIDAIPAVMDRLGRAGARPQRIILTQERMDGAKVRALLDIAHSLGVNLSRLPRLTDFRAGDPEKSTEPRPIAIEDLLGRPQTVLDRASMRALINGKRVLVTGAGGTIGAELVRQICAFGPDCVALLDNSEYQLYQIDLEISERYPDLARHAILADVRDRARLETLLAGEKPDLVFHAAALKHVPLVEANPHEGVLTNVVGTKIVADASRAAGVPLMVLISTDKAVNPTSVMGATKRIAESYCQALDTAGDGVTRFVTVRFGNVLGSTGSVVPLFQRQLAAGGPLTVTHPNMKRYFMTVREAVELVLQASALGRRAPELQGKITVLDMGEPIRIYDLARQMIFLAGLEPDVDIKIEFTQPRPGEKLAEEVLHGTETLVPTEYEGILIASPRTADAAVLTRAIAGLEDAARSGARATLADQISRLVPEYRPDAQVGTADAIAAAKESTDKGASPMRLVGPRHGE